MKSFLADAGSSFRLAAAIGAICSFVAVVIVLLNPTAPPIENPVPVDLARFEAASAVAFTLIALALRRRQEAAAYALLAAACVFAGGAIDALWSNSVTAQSPAFPLRVLVGAAMVPAPTAILAIFASTPPRRFARWTPAVLAALVGATILAVAIEIWIELSGWDGESLGYDYSSPFAGWVSMFNSVLAAGPPLVLAMLGSVRNEALRQVPGSAPPRVARPASRALLAGFALALPIAFALAWAALEPLEFQESMLLPMLLGLIGIAATRWSAYLAWMALAISFGLSAGTVLAAADEIAIGQFVSGSAPPWVPTNAWLAPIALGSLVLILAFAAASIALRAARSAMGGRARATPGPLALTMVMVGLTVWFQLLVYVGNGIIIATWFLVLGWGGLLAIAAAEGARGRLVPAIAEAEAVAGRPLRPLKYLDTVVVEALTGRASLRRAATAAERSKLASDLHAELLPSLAEVAAQHEAGASKEEVALRLRRLGDEIRDLMAERRLVLLEEFGLVEAIEWLLGRAEERESLDIDLAVDERTTPERPPREVERAAFRIAQLAVENALQHGSPTRLALQVLARSDSVRISVTDDGRGIGDAPGQTGRDHTGIADMRSQAADVRGDVQVVAPPTGGTTVTFAWPAA
jgi:signal transduction histidine kinase